MTNLIYAYKKKDEDKPDKYINYYVTLTLNSGMLNCKCNRVTGIPGTNNGNVTLGINVQLGDGKAAIVGGRTEYIQFSFYFPINKKGCHIRQPDFLQNNI